MNQHGLGEYHTPDWLAAKIVKATVTAPLEQRVLDPACGSGTFLFHAARHFLREAEEVGQAKDLRAAEVCAHVVGMDIHPVAVIIARVTYLLALHPRSQPARVRYPSLSRRFDAIVDQSVDGRKGTRHSRSTAASG
jgi:hypothetical protein